MLSHNLWSLRLGFSTKQGEEIKKLGLSNFIDKSFDYVLPLSLPDDFQELSLKNMDEMAMDKTVPETTTQKNLDEQRQAKVKLVVKNGVAIKKMILQRAYQSQFPLKENIAMFWHNHFVSTMRAVKNTKWVYDHYATIHEFGTGNYKELVKNMISTNAMIKYLNNDQNRKGKINENLGRELLELFTLGEGHYSEKDIKNTAKALAGLSIGPQRATYRPRFTDEDDKDIFGEKGNFKLNEVIDLIFKQKSVPYFITRKILKWFIYDNPPEELVIKYGDYLKDQNFELKPFFKYLFLKEGQISSEGAMIKNPLKFAYQICHDLDMEEPPYLLLQRFLKNQGMDIYEQVNVEGWQGGRDWLSSHIYLGRQGFVDVLLSGGLGARAQKFLKSEMSESESRFNLKTRYPFDKNTDAQNIITTMMDKQISIVDKDYKEELNKILVYDFDPKAEGAQQNINRLYQYITSSPEFQII